MVLEIGDPTEIPCSGWNILFWNENGASCNKAAVYIYIYK